MSFSVAVIGDGVVVKESGIPGAGNGLWAARQFSRNELITEYQGKLIDHDKALKLRARGQHTHIRVLNSMHLYIDGLKQPEQGRGGASFANDARDADITNAVFIQKFDARLGRDRVFLKALRDIDSDEEVFVSYGKTYWQNSKCDAQSVRAQRSPLQQLQQVSNAKCCKNRQKHMLPTGTTLLQLLTESQQLYQSSQQSSATVQQQEDDHGQGAATEPTASSLTYLYVATEAYQARAKLMELGQQRKVQQLRQQQHACDSSSSQDTTFSQLQPRRSSRVTRIRQQHGAAAAAAPPQPNSTDPLSRGWGVGRPLDDLQLYHSTHPVSEDGSPLGDSDRTATSVGLMDALYDMYSKVTNCVSQMV